MYLNSGDTLSDTLKTLKEDNRIINAPIFNKDKISKGEAVQVQKISSNGFVKQDNIGLVSYISVDTIGITYVDSHEDISIEKIMDHSVVLIFLQKPKLKQKM